MATSDCLAIVNEEIILHLNPNVVTQIEQDILELSDRFDRAEDVIYKLNSQKLLEVLASSVGFASLRRGAIVIWTYFTNDSIANAENIENSGKSPILKTLMSIDGYMSQQVCQDILQHPEADRILKAHSYLIRQISRQFLTAIADYVEAKLRPFAIASISTVTVIAWCEPLQGLGQKLNLPEQVNSNCWGMAIAAPVVVLGIWWINSKLPFPLPDIPRSFENIGKSIVKVLENRIFRFVAIASIAILIGCWAIVKFTVPNEIYFREIAKIALSFAELYLPIAIISLRKVIVSALGNIFFRYSFFVKLIFGRFIR